jgi:MSHA biogenesis protein MshE
VQVNEKIDLSFAKVLRASLRQDPDILLLGEMRDQETAQIGMRAAMTGHLVLSTLHTNDAISTTIRLLDMGVPRYMMGSSLQAVLAQRLVRVICESCRAPHVLSAAEQEWLSLDVQQDALHLHQYHSGRGCGHCNGTGYRGRMGVYELLEMTKAVVDAAHSEDNTYFMEVAKRQMGGNTLRKNAIDLVLSGVTTVSEAMRISNQIDE